MRLSRVEVARTGWGIALLLAPGPVLRHVHHAPDTRVARGVLRVLGARHVAQGVGLMLRPEHGWLALGATTDALHGLSAVPLALTTGPYGRAGRVEVVVATSLAALESERWARAR